MYIHKIHTLIFSKILIIQIYAPNAEAEEETIKKFYAYLENVIKEGYYRIIMGHWNSKVGEEEGRAGMCRNVEKYGLGRRNKWGGG